MKETKSKVQVNRDPDITGFNYDEFFNNQLSLSDNIKKHLKSQGLDWRFINAQQFKNAGNVHRSRWQAHIFPPELRGEYGCNPEGTLQRGDLILATRGTQVSAAHRKFLKERNKLQSDVGQHQREAAKELKKNMRDAGLEDQSKISEGYDEN